MPRNRGILFFQRYPRLFDFPFLCGRHKPSAAPSWRTVLFVNGSMEMSGSGSPKSGSAGHSPRSDSNQAEPQTPRAAACPPRARSTPHPAPGNAVSWMTPPSTTPAASPPSRTAFRSTDTEPPGSTPTPDSPAYTPKTRSTDDTSAPQRPRPLHAQRPLIRRDRNPLHQREVRQIQRQIQTLRLSSAPRTQPPPPHEPATPLRVLHSATAERRTPAPPESPPIPCPSTLPRAVRSQDASSRCRTDRSPPAYVPAEPDTPVARPARGYTAPPADDPGSCDRSRSDTPPGSRWPCACPSRVPGCFTSAVSCFSNLVSIVTRCAPSCPSRVAPGKSITAFEGVMRVSFARTAAQNARGGRASATARRLANRARNSPSSAKTPGPTRAHASSSNRSISAFTMP